MLMEMRNISKQYTARGRAVVKDISFSLDFGETVALFGDSGSGKSTIGQIMAGLIPSTSGEILFEGQVLKYPFKGKVRREIQLLFQHPEVSFNPRMKLIMSLREPARFLHQQMTDEALLEHLEAYGIYREHMNRYPVELSGGELQRMALARIMLVKPRLIVLDEPTSMLDVISQAQMVRLLQQVQERDNMGYLFISHDIELSRRFAQRIYRLEDGKLLEMKAWK
jgi:ABC-type dipeptide/oligopeptide/nickel transport system ATPase subunit